MHGRHRRLKRLSFHAGVRFLEALARGLPRPLALELFAHLGALVGRVDRPAVRRSEEHLEIAFGDQLSVAERRAIVRRMFQSHGRIVVDLLRLPDLGPERLEKIVRFEGEEHLHHALAAGRGVLAVSAHLGNWEILGAALAARGHELHVMTRPVFDARSDRFLNERRRGAGLVVHARERGLLGPARALRRGAIVGVLLDQDTQGPGVYADFFGRSARTASAPLALARRMGAAIVPMTIHLDEAGVHRVRVHPALPESRHEDPARRHLDDVSAWNQVLEREIAAHPAQWVWFHRRWKSSLSAAEPRAAREVPSPRTALRASSPIAISR